MEKEFCSLWSACNKYYEGHDMEEGKVGGAFGTYRGNLKKGDHWEEQAVDGTFR
jgi:hypothetical protein